MAIVILDMGVKQGSTLHIAPNEVRGLPLGVAGGMKGSLLTAFSPFLPILTFLPIMVVLWF
jgi:hypothetical protein